MGAPCFSRGSWTSVRRKKFQLEGWASALGFRFPALKRMIKVDPCWSAEALLPRMIAGGSHRAAWSACENSSRVGGADRTILTRDLFLEGEV